MTHAATDINPSKTTDEQKLVASSGLMVKLANRLGYFDIGHGC
jgi:hypothetical protein